MKYDKSYGIVPVRQTNGLIEVFLVQNSNGNFWGFPKGHLEKNENEKNAAERELFEETKLQVIRYLSEDPFIEKYKYQLNDNVVDKTVYYYLAETTYIYSIQENEIVDGKWVKINQAYEIITYQECRNMLKQIENLIKDEPFKFFKKTD